MSNIAQKIESPSRPILRYHGGKWGLAPWIISHLPEHRIYVEPYCGAASVLLQKKRSYSEVINDMDSEIVNLFSVCRKEGDRLATLVSLTPYSRKEFELSYIPTDDNLEQARRTVVRAYMGFGSAAASGRKTGFRANANRSGTTPAHDWANYPDALVKIIERLRGVIIENKPALSIMAQQDSSETLHYLDPPYLLSTRWMGDKTKSYRFEMSEKEHADMCSAVLNLKGKVVISGYANELYDTMLKGFRIVRKKSFADGAAMREECLWLSPNIPQQINLFQ